MIYTEKRKTGVSTDGEISYGVGKIGEFTSHEKQEDWNTIKRSCYESYSKEIHCSQVYIMYN